MSCTPSRADFETVVEIGKEAVYDELPYSIPNESVDAPGSPLLADNHFYVAGTYPAPIGDVATTEDWKTNFSWNLWEGMTKRIYFSANGIDLSQSRISVILGLLAGGSDNQPTIGKGHRDVIVRHNGVDVSTTLRLEQELDVFFINFNAQPLPPSGLNYIEIQMIGAGDGVIDQMAIHNFWMHLDFVKISIHSDALTDQDGDGLPLYWEQENLLDDSDASDATLDLDKDGLTNLGEFAAGTLARKSDFDGDGLLDGEETQSDPKRMDTDGDSLPDRIELGQTPASNPNLKDSDGDGHGDAWEKQTGFDPSDNNSVPPPFSSAIGINFPTILNKGTLIPEDQVAGVVPQIFWNQPRLLSWGNQIGDTNAIRRPVPQKIVDSNGDETTLEISWTAGGVSGKPVKTPIIHPIDRLLAGGLSIHGAENIGVEINLTQIPFTQYDLIVYPTGDTDQQEGVEMVLNNDESTRVHLKTLSEGFLHPRFFESIPSPFNLIPPSGNFLRYRNLSGPTLKIEMPVTLLGNPGIAAIQLIDRQADQDSDGLPDSWELEYGYNYALAGDQNMDTDGDGLINLDELNRGTHPGKADTDGDGLSDLVETDSGIYVNRQNTGTDPLRVDTDGDRISDRDELYETLFATNPLKNDEDADGINDREEWRFHLNPLANDGAVASVPVFSNGNQTLTWTIDDLQVIWDRRIGIVNTSYYGLVTFFVRNFANPEGDLDIRFVYVNGSLRIDFSSRNGSFFDAGSSGDQYLYFSSYPNAEDNKEESWNLLGLSNTPTLQISDRLKLEFTAQRQPGSSFWNLNLSVFNYKRGEVVATDSRTNILASSSILDGSAAFGSWENEPGVVTIWKPAGLDAFFTKQTLNSSNFNAIEDDSDRDGLPDNWETLYGFSTDTPQNINADADLDGISNLDEWLLGLNPTKGDSDGDGINDLLEVSQQGNPGDANTTPDFFSDFPTDTTDDLDYNGVSDVWEFVRRLTNQDLTLDSDFDGFLNGLEIRAGTNPFDKNSNLRVGLNALGDNLQLIWPDLGFGGYSLAQSNDLSSWKTLDGTAQNGRMTHTIDNAFGMSDSWFFNLSIPGVNLASTLGSDNDGDGLSDWLENKLNLSDTSSGSGGPAKWIDTDNDKQPDQMVSGDLHAFYSYLNDGSSGEGRISQRQAARFLTQATFGPTMASIAEVQKLGFEGWLDRQVDELEPTLLLPQMHERFFDYIGARVKPGNLSDHFFRREELRTPWGKTVLTAEDQLRQRMALAFSEILVISHENEVISWHTRAVSSYYDIFLENAFGNYFDILMQVTFHPIMGIYLTHLGNQKAQPEINLYPDENYARELMQLFTIGLWQLNPDGSRKLDNKGQPIPTYNNSNITELARVLTGFWLYQEPWGQGHSGLNRMVYAKPMEIHPDKHDYGEKTLLGGVRIPARQASPENARQDIYDAIRLLFEHPNTPVFISRQLIQFFVTDNPSPQYIERIQNVFVDNGQGVRGDLKAVIKAILMDAEARDWLYANNTEHFGRLREPLIRAIHLGRIFGVGQEPNFAFGRYFYGLTSQDILSSPTVFNFFQPGHLPAGELGDQGFVGPVFQITNSVTTIAFPNVLWSYLNNGYLPPVENADGFHPGIFLDYSSFIPLEKNPEALVEQLNLLLCQGQMTAQTRETIVANLMQVVNPTIGQLTQLAVYAIIVSPESAVLR
ncbi:MAG: DUF1800 family protein [Verrucomicrobia bacterium]|nr:DUF1800 family protein [Verrucomicrobiota bacterium]